MLNRLVKLLNLPTMALTDYADIRTHFMTSRFSQESLIKAYDKGYRSFNWISRLAKKHVDLVGDVDLNKIILEKKAKEMVQSIEPIKFYRALMANGASDSLEILQLASDEQVTRILDYDTWHEGKLIPRKAFQWLSLFAEIGKKELYGRFKALEEEYQLALLTPFIRVYEEEEYENLSDIEQDALYSFPNNSIYYKILTDDSIVETFIHDLLTATMEENMEYALSLVAHASYLPPNESEQSVSQFRNARNEEDGFVPYEEAVTAFYPIDNQKLEAKWNALSASTAEGIAASTGNSDEQFLAKVLEFGTSEIWTAKQSSELNDSFMYLANQLASSLAVEPGDLEELKKLLEQVYSLTGFALESLSNGDYKLAATLLREEYPKTLFRYSVTRAHHMRRDVISFLKKLEIEGVDTLDEYYTSSKFGMCLDWIDKNLVSRISLHEAEVLKGLFNRFVLCPRDAWLSSDDSADRFEFSSLENIASYERLEIETASICYMIQLSVMTSDGKFTSVESALVKSMASVFSGGKFINKIFSAEAADKVLSTTAEERRAKLDELFLSIPTILSQINVNVEFKSMNVDNDKVAGVVISKLSSLALGLETSIVNAETNDFYKYLTTV
jgi:hypothetical protein